MVDIKYFNELLYRLEELFYHELSDCAGWKTEYIGIDFIQSRNIQGAAEDDIIPACIEEITGAGLVKGISYSITGHDVLLSLKIDGCCHLAKEKMLRDSGIKPYNCPITNMILDQLIEKLNYETTYVAEIDIDEAREICIVKAAIFATKDKIGAVCDWSEECPF